MRRAILSLATILTGLGLSACAYDDHYGGGSGRSYGDYSYAGQDWRGRHPGPYRGELRGPGVEILDPWLLETPEGRAIVTVGFRDAVRGRISEAVAERANIWFRQYADQDRDMRITDPEIRLALIYASREHLGRRGRGGY